MSWSTADRSLATSPKSYLFVDELYFNAKNFVEQIYQHHPY